MSENTQTVIKCTDCGKTATVPFKPTAGKPVYCRECLSKHRSSTRREPGRPETRAPQPANGDQAWSRRRENWR
ncbi:hypothetical protein GX563_00125 [Candidatus Bathyarchaeota archaeon]|nr:hypothetical protein [Candidatus Bathyarchaeota archaeon]